MTRYFNVNKVYFNGFTNDSVKNIVNSVNCNNVYFINNTASNIFNNAPNLTSVTNIHNTTTNLSGAFCNCYNISTIPTIPNTVTDLSNTFMYCYNITNVTFAENSSVTNMANAFYNCINLQEAVIPNNVTNLCRAFRNCTTITYAPTIPDSVTNMVDTFHYCANLTSVNNISNNADNLYLTFSGTGLTDMPIIPNSVTNMYSTFHKCYNLVNVTEIPESVEVMDFTFSQCNNLTGDIYIKSEEVKSAGSCFYGTGLEKNVYIPYNYTENSRSYEGIINGNIVGTLTNNNGVISNFSANNYFTPDITNFTTANPWEIDLKVITSNDVSTRGQLFQYKKGLTTETRFGINIQISDSHFQFDISYTGTAYDIDGNTAAGTYTVLPNTTYWIRQGWTGTEYYLEYSTDGINYSKDISIQSSTPTLNGLKYPVIGCYVRQPWSSNTYSFSGSIDLNECYIKINNELGWEGISYPNTTTYNTFKQLYPLEIGGTISGTLTNDNGIISGFSGSSRVIMSTPLAPNGNPWELIIKAKVNSNFRDTWNSLFGREDMSGGMNLHISSSGTIKNEWSSNGSSWNIGSITGNTVLTIDKWYWIKTGWTGTQYYLSLSEDGTTYISQGTLSSTTAMYNAPDPQYIGNHYGDNAWKYFRGTIDLNKTYFTINNIICWNGTYDLFKADYRKATFNGTNHGALINNEAILSNFGETNYFILPEPFNTSTANTWEMKYKVVFKNNSVRLTGAKDNTTVAQIVIGVDDTTHKLIWWLSSNGASWNIATSESGQGTTTLIDGQTYYIKATFDGSKYQCYLSTDNINYILQLNINSSTKLFNNNSEFFIGNAELWGNWGDGTIDLKECYIKINDQIWWQGSSGYKNNGVLFKDINAIPVINVEGYEYLLDGTESVTLTRYIGEGGAVTIPGI